MIERRIFLVGFAGAGLLAACMPKGPGTATIVAEGTSGMNPGPDGTDRPLNLQIVQLRGPGAFDSADFYGLQNPSDGLAPDFISAEQITLAPGGKVNRVVTLDPAATVIAVIAGYRDPAGKTFRVRSAVSSKDNTNFLLSAGASGITFTAA